MQHTEVFIRHRSGPDHMHTPCAPVHASPIYVLCVSFRPLGSAVPPYSQVSTLYSATQRKDREHEERPTDGLVALAVDLGLEVKVDELGSAPSKAEQRGARGSQRDTMA